MKTIEIIPPEKSLKGKVAVPGSKSYTNRALVIASLVKNEVTIKNPLFSDDTNAMIECLKTLGIDIAVEKNAIYVNGSISNVKRKIYPLNARLSGTTIRFLLALSCIIPGSKIITGDEGLINRPIKDLVDGLRQLGAEIYYMEKEGYPPIKVTSSTLKEGSVFLNGSISSQFFSAILMIAPNIGEITIHVKGKQISKPFVDMTIDSMKHFGVSVVNNSYQSYTVPENQKYYATEYNVEGDFSSASYFFAIAALTKSTIKVLNLNPNSVQADKEFLKSLEKMGNIIQYASDSITVHGKGVKPLTVNMNNCPDQAQTAAVLTAFAKGTTKLTGIQSLRVKETERIKALETELEKMGIKTHSTFDSLTIFGGNPKPALINTYDDHRMAMSFAVAGTKLEGMQIQDPDAVSKTFPEFWKKLEEIGIHTNVILKE